MTVGEYIDELLNIIEELQEYDDDNELTVHEDENGYTHFILGAIDKFADTLN
ncbi:MAG TPA: hypothetical protein VLS94_08890 [Fusibacter sp.]|nr:hypothetical protein [Fusibacter sp.]